MLFTPIARERGRTPPLFLGGGEEGIEAPPRLGRIAPACLLISRWPRRISGRRLPASADRGALGGETSTWLKWSSAARASLLISASRETKPAKRKRKKKSPSMCSDFQKYSFRMPNIGFQNLPLNIYIVVFGTAIFVFILSLLFCCYLIRLCCLFHRFLSLNSERLRLLIMETEASSTQGAICIQAGYTKGEGERAQPA
ncbi:RING finger protein 24 isoform X2 [Rhinatrema bivittatum]|uniref:RING finger protein 24 isoform X2 n=1 Tax=Rhinatrema bivittatum TaxID=194408 RepID=UPI00112C2F74|nr:RING finger protein 24 isoform X2 [Rhinatrema bivittatum]